LIKYHKDIEQGTPEWSELRRGIITASTAGKLITTTGKVANNETVRQLAYSLAAERITGRVAPSFVSYDMERGHIEEVFARDLYGKHYAPVTQCGFIESDRLGFRMGYSPDGLVGEDGLIEVKSRMAKFQVETFFIGEVPSEYAIQLQFALMVTQRPWIDFVQYSNGMALFVKRVEPDHLIAEAMYEAVSLFEDRLKEVISDYEASSEGCPVAEYVQHVDGSEIEVAE